MATVNPQDENEIPLTFTLGINNVAKESKLPDGAVRSMINLDLVGDVPTMREGRNLVYPGTGMHSLWSHPLIQFGLFVEGTDLKTIHESMDTAVIKSGLSPRERSYEFFANRVYHSNGVDTGIVNQAGVASPWGVESPKDTYTLAPAAGGGLPAGEYRVALTFLAGGEESGAYQPQFVVLSEGDGIVIDQLPAPIDTGVTALRVYVSPANDPRLFFVRDVAIGMSTVTIGAGGRGDLLDTLGMVPMPPGRYLLGKNSRIYSASGRLLRWTESLRYGLHDPVNNYMPVPETITGIGSPFDGNFSLYIGGTSKTILLQGTDISDAKVASVMHIGMVPGSLIHLDADALGIDGITMRCPVWMGTNGMFYVGTSQSAMLLNKGVAGNIYQQAAAAYFEQEGLQRFVVAGRGGRKADLAIRDRAVARVES